MFFQPRHQQIPYYPPMPHSQPQPQPSQPNMYQHPVSPLSPIPMTQQKKQPKMPKNPMSRRPASPTSQSQPPIKMFAPPGVDQPVQGFNPLINGNALNNSEKRDSGIISKLFGNTTRTVAGGGATAAATGVNLVSSLNTVLDNVQKANQIAKNVKPAVERFGPMVKNFPNLMKIYNEVKNTPANSEESSNKTEIKTKVDKSPKKASETTVATPVTEKKEAIPTLTAKKNLPTSNGPKLYI